MLTLDLARALFGAGVMWTPQPGDRFIVPGRDMDTDVFVVSDMTIEVHDFPTGRVIGFNGTTEWALDSLNLVDVVWIPREAQLRELIGERLVSLRRRENHFEVTVTGRTGVVLAQDADCECAYALALLDLLSAS